MEKRNPTVIILITILVLLVLVLVGYIVYDKVLLDNDDNNNQKEETNNNWEEIKTITDGNGAKYNLRAKTSIDNIRTYQLINEKKVIMFDENINLNDYVSSFHDTYSANDVIEQLDNIMIELKIHNLPTSNINYQYLAIEYSNIHDNHAIIEYRYEIIGIDSKNKVSSIINLGRSAALHSPAAGNNFKQYNIVSDGILFYYIPLDDNGIDDEEEIEKQINDIVPFINDFDNCQQAYYYLKITFEGINYKIEKEENPPFTDINKTMSKC